jgi:hypothetical protein
MNNDKIRMNIEIKIELTREVLEDIFVTALEGGSNYWYLIGAEAIKKVRAVVPDRSIPFSQALFSAVYDHEVDVEIHDIEEEEDEGAVGTISMSTMNERLQKCATDDTSWAILNEINENGDATSSDVIFQYIALGEVVYA